MSAKKKTAEAPEGAHQRSTTESSPSGSVMRVDNPLDLWYLCEKVSYAQRFPKVRSDGQLMYQRVVTQLIRQDNEMFSYHFPYIGEVGYDMTHNPPKPIMSRKEPQRPSRFPLGRYAAIKQRHTGYLLQSVRVERTHEMLSLGELEDSITPSMRSNPGAAKPLPDIVRRQLQSVRGLFRIPDVIRIQNLLLSGVHAFSQDNLQTVIEIKFEGDDLSDEQAAAYQKIAGKKDKFRLLETRTCEVDDRRKRDWLRDAQKEPVYRPVGLAGLRTDSCLRPDVQAYPLLEGRVEQEYQTLQHYLNPTLYPLPTGPTMVAIDPAQEAQRARERERAVAGMGSVLALPLVAVGTLATAPTGAAMVGSAATRAVAAVVASSEKALIGRIAGQLVPYTRQVVASVQFGATRYAMAETEITPSQDIALTMDDFINDPARQEQNYLYWPD